MWVFFGLPQKPYRGLCLFRKRKYIFDNCDFMFSAQEQGQNQQSCFLTANGLLFAFDLAFYFETKIGDPPIKKKQLD